MALKKDDLVELVRKDDNGWWLVKKDGEERWAPSDYLEYVPPKPKATAAPAPPRRPPPPSKPAPAPAAQIPLQSVTANATAKPVSVFPGMGPSDGSAAPWKRTANATNNTPSSTAVKPPPPVASKPKVGPSSTATKSGPALPPKPPAPPVSSKPSGSAAKSRTGAKGAPVGQMDLAAAVSCISLSKRYYCSMMLSAG